MKGRSNGDSIIFCSEKGGVFMEVTGDLQKGDYVESKEQGMNLMLIDWCNCHKKMNLYENLG